MRTTLLMACLIVVCGCADREAGLRSQAESQASFIQGLSDGYSGKDSPPPTRRLDRSTLPTHLDGSVAG
jgi:hypothetical protein